MFLNESLLFRKTASDKKESNVSRHSPYFCECIEDLSYTLDLCPATKEQHHEFVPHSDFLACPSP